jgi:NTP pyrophosphatase (non-canonical NTP hydrolase)
MSKFEKLQTDVLIWAKQRDLLRPENANSQFLKVAEELGEFAGAIAKNKRAEMKDGLGDTLVTLIILANQLDLDLVGCLDIAYNEIKNRTGRTVDGTFIKDE